MTMRSVLQWMFSVCIWLTSTVFAGDLTCYGHKSTTSHFACGVHGNCVWWAAYRRPDLAAKIVGSGWDAGKWYGQFKALGFPVGLEPKAGSIVEFSGHVSYVERVNSDGSFDVSEMDWYGRLGTGNDVQHATYYPDGSGKYHRDNGPVGGWILNGFIYSKESCDPSKEKCALRIDGTVGWFPPIDDCQQASQWFQLVYDASNKVSRIEPTVKASCPLACYAN